jgi:hypothetical protein
MSQQMTAAEDLAYISKKPAADTSTPAAGQSAATAKKTREKRPSPTNALTKSIIMLLTLEGCAAWRQNNGAVYDASFGGYRAGSVTPGISDVLGYHKATGRFVAVEVKTGSDTLSEEQIAFLDNVRAAGGFACEGRSIDQVRREFIEWRTSLPS